MTGEGKSIGIKKKHAFWRAENIHDAEPKEGNIISREYRQREEVTQTMGKYNH